MIAPTLESLRLFLHVLAASVWVGGQLVVGALVPGIRSQHPEMLRTVANAFGRVAWPALAVAVLTGMWNLLAVDPTEHGNAYLVTLAVKLGLVAVAAISALIHSNARSRVVLAVGGAVGLLSSLSVTWLGILLSQAG